jgi:hypothetical protein
MSILRFPTNNYLECVDRLERAIFQIGSFRHYNIGREEGCIVLDIDDDLAQAVEEIYKAHEHASA